MTKPYTLLDHTADLKIRIVGATPADLFKNAGLALFELIIDPQIVDAGETILLEISGEDLADLMVNYLRELLYLWTGGGKLVKMIDIQAISSTLVKARVTLGPCRPDRRHRVREIKAVTYHQIAVEPAVSGWQATVVLDI